MSNKSKGSKTERELYQIFVDNNYRAVRVAGSGMMENADCDIIAGKRGGGRKYCIEAKSCKKLPKYISKDQINRFIVFADIFGLKPVIAIRYSSHFLLCRTSEPHCCVECYHSSCLCNGIL